ncbi:hypothetical protein [Streptomyces sp. S.PB5]|uniref:hypothetical protein n=1 Tax=Streptomyces sp. S.PB5 TaxID=3020844 RepID=UPI0025AF5D6B|nr:hypothetical protein [Streptomyces sp. S.PB5]MDN3021424.1 hypothetical protein [Streptomyces sp. S.PB5]
MTAGWGSRTVRAAVFAAVCVLLAALGHVLMSGRHVPGWALATGAALTGAAGWCLAGRERGLPAVVAVVVAAQAALHEGFSLAQPTISDGGGMGSMPMGPMHLHSMDAMDMTHIGAGHTASAASSSLGMFAAHLLAALLCGLWLAYGERAAFRILRAVAGWLAAPLRLLLAVRVPAHRPLPGRPRRRAGRAPRLLLLVHAITTRGPPVGTAVV